jgi:ParB family chromosome partitioning protein
MTARTTIEPATWPLGRLRPHPRQSELFADLPDEELDELAEDIRARGLQHAIEVLPDGTVVAGHQRLRAVRKLKWKTVAVIIRHDLAAQGEAAVECHMIADNLRRRQLNALALARCYERLREIEKERGPGQLLPWERGDLRDRIARRLGCSGGSLDRWLRILRLPQPIQRAVEDGSLSQRQAIRVAALSEGQQQEIADGLAGGGSVRGVLARHLARAVPRRRGANDALAAFVRALEVGLHDLGDRVEAVGRIDAEAAATLVRGGDMIGRLLARAKPHS